MAPLLEPAVPTLLSSVSLKHVGKKLRVVGTMIGYDMPRDLLMLMDRETYKAVLVDASVVIASTRDLPWLRGGKATLMVSGYLDAVDGDIALPDILPWALEPQAVLLHAVLRATIINDANDLDLPKWNATVKERESVGLGL